MSKFFKLNWADFGKGIVVAVFGAMIQGMTQAVSSGQPIDIKQVGATAAIAGGAYLVKQLSTNSQGSLLTGEPAVNQTE
jgi:hypothetical protein